MDLKVSLAEVIKRTGLQGKDIYRLNINPGHDRKKKEFLRWFGMSRLKHI